jgi:hypothetical protein
MKNGAPLRSAAAILCLGLISACATTPSTTTKSGTEYRADVMIPMSDGVDLATNIALPPGDGPHPVILVRTPYGKDGEGDVEAREIASRGYVYVVQDCRGTGNSEGEWEPIRNEARDGLDTHQWILDQPWCNGNIGTDGASYVGWTQWAVAADTGDSHKAMFTVVPLIDQYRDSSYTNGAFGLGTLMTWGTEMLRPTEGEGAGVDTDSWDWDAAYRRLPLSEWDKNIGYEVTFLRDWIAHPTFDDYWKETSIIHRLNEVDVPNVTISGWYDIFVSQALEHVTTVRKTSVSDVARRHQHVVVGPWAHGTDGSESERDFGKNAQIDYGAMSEQWFAHWLKGEDTDIGEWAPYRIFVMGRNEWRDEYEWPLARTRYTPHYFHSDGSANTRNGDGVLSIDKPGNQSTDTFIYDPQNPVPTVGGNVLFGELYGAHDQREVEERDDVLVFTGTPLKEEVEVTGPIKIVLYASTTSPDTDFTGKLVDVYPDGRAFNLCEGIVRARWRNATPSPEFINPGQVYRYEIDLWATSNVFLPGHRIRVEISSSNFPRFDRNLNTDKLFGTDSEIRKATQTIYHDTAQPSHILLPIIP